MKLKDLEKLEAKYPEMFDEFSPTQKVGSDKTDDFKTVKHKVAMLSLGNTYFKYVEDTIKANKDGEPSIEKFFNDTADSISNQLFFTAEVKFDGASLSISYRNNRIVKAVTRGDGEEGDDVTDNVKAIPSIPNILSGEYPKEFEVRGEIVMPRDVFAAINKKKVADGEKTMANPRNAASGSLKLRNLDKIAGRGLKFMPFQLIGDFPKSHYAAISTLKQDFDVFDLRLAPTNSFMEIENFIDVVEEKRAELPFDIDGVVLKVDDSDHYDQIGYTSKVPKWATAYKYKAEQATTKLDHVNYQTGKTGQITPVANLIPVQLAGTTVKRASLHNEENLILLDLHEGDTVIVEKGGEIIPQITGVIKEDRDSNAQPILHPKVCPDCGSPIKKKTNQNGEESSSYFCTNVWLCPSQVKGKIEYFVSKKCMDIQGIGESTVEELYDKGLVKRVEDLYSLTADDMRNAHLEKFGERKIEIALEGIKKSKEQPYSRVLTALGIDGVGTSASKKLCKVFKNIKQLKNAKFSELIAVEDIGDGTANNILEFFKVPENEKTVLALFKYGLQFEAEEPKANVSEALKGKTIVISGNFGTSARRKELEAMVEDYGGKLSKSVSSKTSYFVAGEKVGPSKLDKATKNNVPIINEENFLKLLK
jgi:DNA ligase (NAD+)